MRGLELDLLTNHGAEAPDQWRALILTNDGHVDDGDEPIGGAETEQQ